MENKYKLSNYNQFFSTNHGIYISNVIRGGLGKLDSEFEKIYRQHRNEPDLILNHILSDNRLLNKMIEGGMVIEENLDELNLLRFMHYAGRFGHKNSMGVTLIPTNACNCRCQYCFEKEHNYPPGLMRNDVLDKVIESIDSYLEQNGDLSIVWFGGEPLLGMDIIRMFYEKVEDLKLNKHLNITSGIITNGTLLSKEISEELLKYDMKFVQVTLDGPEKIHNLKRPFKNGEGTYNKIIKNILDADKNLYISLRINVDKDNINQMPELIKELKTLGIDSRDNIEIYFSMIRDYSLTSEKYCYTTKEYANIENELHDLAREYGFRQTVLPREGIVNCGALSDNNMVIEADGTMQKCWNAVGNKSMSVGNILDNNKNIINANLMKWLGWEPLKKDKCKTCKQLPICFGGCPYFDIYGHEGTYDCSPIACNASQRLMLYTMELERNENTSEML